MRYLSSALSAALLLSFSTAGAQTSAPVRWSDDAPNATSEVKNDTRIKGLKTDDVQIFVSLAELKETEYNRVWVQVFNHGKAPLNIDPQSAILLNGDKSVRTESPDKAANSIQKAGEAKSQELSSAHCNIRMSGQSNGGVGSNCTPTNTEMQMSKQVTEFSMKQAQWVRDNALKQTTLTAGDQAQGAIVFRKDKKPADYVLRMSVGSEIFEFPLSAQNKHPSYD